jgi:hypothetical protein
MTSFHVKQHAIASCMKCAAICNYCASACLMQNDANEMSRCIHLARECSAICVLAAEVMSIGGITTDAVCALVEEICQYCGDECFKFNKEHCSECADMCRRTIAACRSIRQLKNVA